MVNYYIGTEFFKVLIKETDVFCKHVLYDNYMVDKLSWTEHKPYSSFCEMYQKTWIKQYTVCVISDFICLFVLIEIMSPLNQIRIHVK